MIDKVVIPQTDQAQESTGSSGCDSEEERHLQISSQHTPKFQGISINSDQRHLNL